MTKCDCTKVFWLLLVIFIYAIGVYIWEETHLTVNLTAMDAVYENDYCFWYLKLKRIKEKCLEIY